MGEVKNYTPEKLVMGILVRDVAMKDLLFYGLQDKWGTIDSLREAEEFLYTDYYEQEMGSPLYRIFCSFKDLQDPGDLGMIKEESNAMERYFSMGGARQVNLDPGLLSLSKFILATTKDNAHRIPIGRGMYGELTLQYRNKEFQPLEWTYPDYQSQDIRRYLTELRMKYRMQLNTSGAESF